jgi:hypothetical protein
LWMPANGHQRRERMAKIKVCKYCGAEFTSPDSARKYCSGQCARNAQYVRSHKWHLAHQQDPEMKNCVGCGDRFQTRVGMDKCTKCRGGRDNRSLPKQARYADASTLREAEGLRPLNPGRTSCLRCGRDFNSWDRSRNRLCVYCSGYPASRAEL